jgi:lipopolysaccharide export system protein LptA
VVKYVLTFFLFITLATMAMAQKKSVIHLIKSDRAEGGKVNGVLKVYNGTFQQDYSTLRADSAYFHKAENTFDAYGHVVITQGDTMHIYSDLLNYSGNTKIAILTNNVRMVDKDATLTTNNLTYNTATKYGTYVNGGKLVNKDNTLTSKNGYYYANTRDSYFRYDVHLTTPDAFIVTDTLRYNSNTRISYFYGPTHIYGKKKGKDNDTLYTENGTYNTNTEQAFFGKKNLYKSGPKSLTGDSLFYDRKKGIGHAINHITFMDTEQKMTLKGDIGDYTKADERTVVTKHAYVVMVTEEKDTTKNDSLKKASPDTVNAKKDSANTKKGTVKSKRTKSATPATVKSVDKPKRNNVPAPQTNVKSVTDTASKKGKKTALNLPKLPVDTSRIKDTSQMKKDTGRMKHDSIFMTADTLDTRVMTYKDYKDMQEKIRLSQVKDTTKRPPSIVYKTPVKFIELSPPKMPMDTTFLHRNFFGPPKKETAQTKPGKPDVGKPDKNAPNSRNPLLAKNGTPDQNALPAKKLTKLDSVKMRQDSIKKAHTIDSVYLVRKIELPDTTHIRILSGFHHVKLFKSDLQGKADSSFYSSGDSTIRLYVHPMLWTQGSQLSGDTITLQMRNKKLNNMEMFPNGFIVNTEKKDSTHFNQVTGKKMRGFFKDDKLTTMFVDGNSETIYFAHDSLGKVTEMQRSLSSRVRIYFKDNKAQRVIFMSKPEHRYGPLEKFTEEDKTLKGFIWKPKDRPVSKEAIINAPDNYPEKIAKAKPPAKTTGKKQAGKKGSKGQKPGAKPVSPPAPAARSATDSLQKQPLKTLDSLKRSQDTVKKKLDTGKKVKDTTILKKPVTQ